MDQGRGQGGRQGGEGQQQDWHAFHGSISGGESACIIVLTYMAGNGYATGYADDMIGIKFRYPMMENWHHVPYQPHD
jgi:hypothetical protein